MSKLAKKIIVSAVMAMVVAAVAVPPSAHAQTAAELNAEISALLAKIQALEAQIAGLGGTIGGGISGIPPGFTFTGNLGQGSSGTDVMYLQMLLNSNPATQVAATGVGSSGSETQFYGPLTTAAVTKFHNTYASEILAPLGLTSGTGFFGASSRAKANSLLAVAPPTTGGTTPPQTTGGTTPPPEISTPGVEGSLVVTLNATPASGAELMLNEVEDVFGVDVKATGSDILVDRLDIQFTKTSSNSARPWLFIQEMTVSDGTTSKTVQVTSSNSVEVTVGSKYYVRVSGLGILVPKDTEKKLTVTMKAVSGLPAGTTTNDMVLTVIADSIRGTDGAGLTQNGPTAALSTRTITVKEGDTANLEITAASDNPKDRWVVAADKTETADVEMAKVNVKVTGNDAILRTVTLTDEDIDTGSSTVQTYYLYDGSTLLSTSGTSTLSDIDLTIAKDTTKVLTLKATVKKGEGNFEQGATSTLISIPASTTGFDAEDASTFGSATVSGSAVSPGYAYLYEKTPTMTVSSTAITGLTAPSGSTSPQQAEATIVVSVTASGGDIYVPFYNATNASSGLVASVSQTGSTTLIGNAITSTADESTGETWVVRSGDTETFTYTAVIDNVGSSGAGTGGDVSVFMKLIDFRWGVGTGTAADRNRDWNLTDFKTNPIFVQSPQS